MSYSFLWILPKSPIPPDDGAKLASYNLLKGLTENGIKIHLICIAQQKDEINEETVIKKLGISSLTIIRRPNNSNLRRFLSLFLSPYLPLTVASFKSRDISEQIFNLINVNGNFDYLVYDGLHVAAFNSKFGKYQKLNIKSIYRAHNCESEIWKRKAANVKQEVTQSIFKSYLQKLNKLFLLNQFSKVYAFENSLVANCDMIATVSNEDKALLSVGNIQNKFKTIPIGYQFEDTLSKNTKPDTLQLMFIGKLDWLPNKDGLKWFLKEVWNEVMKNRQDMFLTIAGSGNGEWLSEYSKSLNVTFLGRIDSVEKLYSTSDLSIVPLFYGSGTRVKVIEASRYKTACLSTYIGVEGIGLEDTKSYIRAETKESWISILNKMSHNELLHIGENAFNHVKENYEYKKCSQNLIEHLGYLNKNSKFE